MPIKQVISTENVPVKIWTDDVDERSKAQLANIAAMPFTHHHVAAMPDVHLGIGATIGSVIATHKAIVPAAVGVDIGCGMVAARLSISADDLDERGLKKVFDQISRDVPVGRALSRGPILTQRDWMRAVAGLSGICCPSRQFCSVTATGSGVQKAWDLPTKSVATKT